MFDCMVFWTLCCNFKFIGMNHSPEFQGNCRHCMQLYMGETTVKPGGVDGIED